MKIKLYPTDRFQVLSLEPPLQQGIKAKPKTPLNKDLHVYLDLNCSYTLEIIRNLFSKYKISYSLGPCDEYLLEPAKPPLPSKVTFQWCEYERITWENIPKINGASSFKFRKGLSRKAQLCHYTSNYIHKYPCCHLSKSIPETIIIQTWSLTETDCKTQPIIQNMDFKERLQLCLADARRWIKDEEELFAEQQQAKIKLAKAATLSPPIWILKASTSNKGEGIHLIHCFEQLQSYILDYSSSNNDDNEEQELTSREWVLQKYISKPLLLQRRKFHIRAYILAVDALRVYFCNNVLFLRSALKYTLHGHSASYLTNTVVQSKANLLSDSAQEGNNNSKKRKKDDCVLLKSDFIQILSHQSNSISTNQAAKIYQDIQQNMQKITSEIFHVYKSQQSVFEPILGCFEIYGFDFMVDEQYNVYLLEINPGPDFRQSGNDCKIVIEKLMEDVVNLVFFGNEQDTDLTKVFEHDYDHI